MRGPRPVVEPPKRMSSVSSSNARLSGTAQTVASVAVLGLAITVRWASDPFATLDIPATDGGGIVPILEHPAMLVHPPLLYIGLALTLPLFAITVAALLHRSCDAAWGRAARTLALTSWCIITVAMALGAAWADDELGWGGFWAWDPVENGVLLPWLALTAFLHAGKRRRATRLTSTLPIVAFLLSSLGALLSRSGAVVSVHAFAEADRVGRFLSVLLVVMVTIGVMALVASLRNPASTEVDLLDGPLPGRHEVVDLHDVPRPGRHWDDRLLVGNAVVILAMTATVLVGTVWPVIRGWSGGRKRAVEPGFYVRFAVPAAVMILVLMAIDAIQSVRHKRSMRGRLAHFGLALFVVGAAAGAFGETVSVTVKAGDTVHLGAIDLRIGEPIVGSSSHYQAVTVPVLVGTTRLAPQLRIYESKALRLSRPDRTMGWDDDVQVSVRGVNADFIQIEAHRRPLLWLVWFGVLIMVAGGLVALRWPPKPHRP